MNTVPRKKGYVPNKYTGRSLMYYGGKKKMYGGSMMMREKERMMHGGMSRDKKGHGGQMKGSSPSIYAMEDACNKMAGYNMSLPKGR
jgi:hypothetical protein